MKLIEKYFEFDDRLSIISDFILNLAKLRGILNSNGGYFSSYSLLLLIIFFLQIQEPPVLESIQIYSEDAIPSSAEIPSFQGMLKRGAYKGERFFSAEDMYMTTINTSYKNVNIQEFKRKNNYPKNNQSCGELITLFFYYFGFEYPVI